MIITKEMQAEYLLSIADDKFTTGSISLFFDKKTNEIDHRSGNCENEELPEHQIFITSIIDFHEDVYYFAEESISDMIQQNFLEDKEIKESK